MMEEKDNTVKGFWEDYKKAAIKSGEKITTAQWYVTWAQRFDKSIKGRPLQSCSQEDVEAFLCKLSGKKNIYEWQIKQAVKVLIFLYRDFLNIDPGEFDDFIRAKRLRRLPEVLTRDEVNRLFDQLKGVNFLMARLLYGAGLRLMECLRLRVKDIDFETHRIIVRGGKGQKDRVTILPKKYELHLKKQLEYAKTLHKKDLASGTVGISLWTAFEGKSLHALKEWIWQYVFPSANLSVDPRTNKVKRHHLHPSNLQKAVKISARKAELSKRVSCHTMRHSFTTHLLEGVMISAQCRSF